MAIDRGDGKLDPELRLAGRSQAQGLKGVPAEPEEIIVDPDRLDLKQRDPDRDQGRIALVAGRRMGPVISLSRLGLRQRLEIELAVDRHRQGRQRDEH